MGGAERVTAENSGETAELRNTLDVTIVLPVYNEVEHLVRRSRARAAVDGFFGIQLRDHRRRRRFDRRFGRARGHDRRRTPDPVRAEPRLGERPQGRDHGRARAHHGLDRRRHVVPERHDARARQGARGLRPSRRRAPHRSRHAQRAAGSREVVHPQARQLPLAHEDPRPQLRIPRVPQPTSPVSTSGTFRPASRASPR